MNRSSDLTDQFPTITSIIGSGVVVATLSVLVLTLKLEILRFQVESITSFIHDFDDCAIHVLCLFHWSSCSRSSPFHVTLRKYNNQNSRVAKAQLSQHFIFWFQQLEDSRSHAVAIWTCDNDAVNSAHGGFKLVESCIPCSNECFWKTNIRSCQIWGLFCAQFHGFWFLKFPFQEMNIAKVESYFTKFHLVVLASCFGRFAWRLSQVAEKVVWIINLSHQRTRRALPDRRFLTVPRNGCSAEVSQV